MENNNKITVLMAVFNGERYLRQSIESILNQTFYNFEFLIINDASRDKSKEILNHYSNRDKRIRIIENRSNLGLTKSLNRGLKVSKGKYIARMDDDDISSIGRLEKQFLFMEQNQDVALCGSLGSVIDENGKEIGKKDLAIKDIKKKLLFNNQFIHSSLFFRKGFLYNETFKKAQDYELVLRIASKYKVANLNEYLIAWRKRRDSLSLADRKQKKFALKARWWAITKYGYPRLKGILHISVRMVQLIFSKK